MTTFVKFCGITEERAIELAPKDGAIGLVIGVAASPRNLSFERAAELAEKVPPHAEVWAVTVDPSAETISRIFNEVGVDWIQVHGAIPTELEWVERHRLVPSVPIAGGGDEVEAPTLPVDDQFRRIHLDSAGGPLPGGTGMLPSWPACARVVEASPGRKVILGGGLRPENVAEALTAVHPWGVDVSSGIEEAPGTKSREKMQKFLDAVAQWDEKNHA